MRKRPSPYFCSQHFSETTSTCSSSLALLEKLSEDASAK
jgi:hypothetical protein